MHARNSQLVLSSSGPPTNYSRTFSYFPIHKINVNSIFLSALIAATLAIQAHAYLRAAEEGSFNVRNFHIVERGLDGEIVYRSFVNTYDIVQRDSRAIRGVRSLAKKLQPKHEDGKRQRELEADDDAIMNKRDVETYMLFGMNRDSSRVQYWARLDIFTQYIQQDK
ncbi:hypothetical protein D9611_002818 [Ephemerocybe angulata]|uniref:Uncharacterized protein n=1 Tax=Ephemerocybe angulata TaxID=980116 RepID=A0A8H5C2Q4_9AGAR|nr:hypothetical protein D9611_002818 [Tulosesus angulatus]